MKQAFLFSFAVLNGLAFAAPAAVSSSAASEPSPTVTKSTITSTPTSSSSSSTNPCAALAASYRSQLEKDSDATPALAPSQVLACLVDVPINKDKAIGLVAWLSEFVSYQSTLAYLKNPPSTYPLPATDLLGGLQNIAKKVQADGYKSEFDFEYDIYKLGLSAYDGHTAIHTLLPEMFGFETDVPLVAVSQDGKTLPSVYFAADIINSNGTFIPSDVITIDGVDVTKRLIERSSGFQDLDALFNDQLDNTFTRVNQRGGHYATSQPFLWFEDTHTYKFRNGSMITTTNSATANQNISDIQSGKDIYDKFLDPENDEPSSTTDPAAPTESGPPPSVQSASAMKSYGFPTPVSIAADNSVAGYFLDSQPDLAILSIFQFSVGEKAAAAENFSSVITEFLAESKKAGKTKLIVDVRGNPGGSIYNGFDTFKQLYPALDAPVMGRLRNHNGANILGSLFSQFSAPTLSDYDELQDASAQNLTEAQDVSGAKLALFNYNTYVRYDKSNFTSWKDFSGPATDHGDAFSNYFSLDFNNIVEDVNNGIIVSGYANDTNVPASPFGNNVVIVVDGACSSTCGIFVNLMVSKGKAKTIAFGGRPSTSPMAAIGGTQGLQVMPYAIPGFELEVVYAANLVEKYGPNVFTAQELSEATEYLKSFLAGPPINIDLATTSVNIKDSYFGGDGSSTPLQFQKVKSADCRVFYQKEDIVNVSSTWNRLATGNYVCVDGGK